MPYIVISGGLNTPTLVGGKSADPDLMATLLAWRHPLKKEWYSSQCPHQVLNMREARGWKVVAMCYAHKFRKNTWTLHKEATPSQ